MTKSYALVLGGGGAKGAYQVGVMRALKKLKIKIHSAIGTSVGALNAALWVMNKVDEAEKIWQTLSIDKVIKIPNILMKDGRFNITLENMDAFHEFRRHVAKNFGADTAPLRKLITSLLDENYIRASSLDFGVVSFQLGNDNEHYIENIPEGELTEYLMASAAFPGFKIQKLNNRVVFDGGMHDNVPVAMARKRGERHVIAVDVSGIGVNRPPDIIRAETIYIKNSGDLDSVLDFDPARAERKIKMGYLDTMKVFGRLEGIDYYFRPRQSIETKLKKRLFQNMDKYRHFLNHPLIENNEALIEKEIRALFPEKLRLHKNLLYVLTECAAKSLNIERVHEYRFDELLRKIREKSAELHQRADVAIANKGLFEKMIEIFKNMTDREKVPAEEYDRMLSLVFGGKGLPVHTRALSVFVPELLPAKILLSVLE